MTIDQLAREANAWACYDCGKCTATCPIARSGAPYSPRRHVLATNLGQAERLAVDGSLFTCLTCGACDLRCPAEVRYSDLVLALRRQTHGAAPEPQCPHGGALQSVQRMMARGTTRQDRLGWLDEGLDTAADTGRIFLWVGCAPYWDAFFGDLGVRTLDGTRAAVRLLNRLGETPVVSPDERCCGHDLLFNGDEASFAELARHNVELVRRSGAEMVVTACAECARTWRVDYPRFADAPPVPMLHLTELLAERLPSLSLSPNGGRRVTYQDPCRLGRHLGVYEPPRELLRAAGAEVAEMAHSRARATCCAGGTWSSCDRYAKSIQVGRLREARASGADVLATACPKCQIHLKCAMKDPSVGDEIAIEIRDLSEIVAEALA